MGNRSLCRDCEHVLDAGRELSEVIRWLPTMFRYGVRTPRASWAMTLGCPSRELSGSLAAGFVSDDDDGRAVYGNFVTWFSSLTEEDFTYRLGPPPNESEILSRRSAFTCARQSVPYGIHSITDDSTEHVSFWYQLRKSYRSADRSNEWKYCKT